MAQTLPHQVLRPSNQNMNQPTSLKSHKSPVSSGKTSSSIGVVSQRPLHPKYQEEYARLKTFRGWPAEKTQKPDKMAQAGFYYAGMKDCVKCYFCNGGLWNWYPGDDPWTEHKRWFPKCGYIQLLKTFSLKKYKSTSNMESDNHSLETDTDFGTKEKAPSIEKAPKKKPASLSDRLIAYMLSVTVKAVINMNMFDEKQIEYVVRRKLESGSEYKDAASIMEDLYSLEDEENCGASASEPEAPKADSASSETSELSSIEEDCEEDDGDDDDYDMRLPVLQRNKQPADVLGSLNIESASSASASVPKETASSAAASVEQQPELACTAAASAACEITQIPKKKKKNKKKKKKPASPLPASSQPALTAEQMQQQLEHLQKESNALEDERKELLYARTCKVCMDKPITTVFLPCGHLTTCEDCSEALRNCPLCRTRINGTVKTFLA